MIEDKYYKKAIIGLLKFTCLVLLSTNFLAASFAADKPNIIWLVSEDNSANLGSYGDLNANTPNLDQLAQSSVQFNNAFATSPVCAAVRFTIYTGTYANVLGTQNMRSRYAVPKFVNPYAHYLEKAGYYLTNSALKNNGTAASRTKALFITMTRQN
jgi:arylsulfatase A-like enzyme